MFFLIIFFTMNPFNPFERGSTLLIIRTKNRKFYYTDVLKIVLNHPLCEPSFFSNVFFFKNNISNIIYANIPYVWKIQWIKDSHFNNKFKWRLKLQHIQSINTKRTQTFIATTPYSNGYKTPWKQQNWNAIPFRTSFLGSEQ